MDGPTAQYLHPIAGLDAAMWVPPSRRAGPAALCLTEAGTTIRSGNQRLLSERTVVSPTQRKYLRPQMDARPSSFDG
jgi:hypothetical protein